jgi:putative oxidoreductase
MNSAMADLAWALMRMALGVLSIGHGLPKLLGGMETWKFLGSATQVIGISFLPAAWGLAGACIEFFGGILLILGFYTRIACLFLIGMMIIATLWHLKRGDPFSAYSFPITLIVVFAAMFVIGAGKFSLDG